MKQAKHLLSKMEFQVFIPLNPTGAEVQHNSAIPNYLPEEEEEVPEQDMNKAISRTTAQGDSSGSWLSTAASFLSKSFYWWNWRRIKDCRAHPVVTRVDIVGNTTLRVGVKLFHLFCSTLKIVLVGTPDAGFFLLSHVNIFWFFSIVIFFFCISLVYLHWFIQVKTWSVP